MLTEAEDYKFRLEALKLAIQTMAQDRARDASDFVRRATIIHSFLNPAEGSREATDGVTS